MDPLAAPVVDLARALVDIDSTSGNEAEATDWLAARLRADGYRVTEQPVAGDRDCTSCTNSANSRSAS